MRPPIEPSARVSELEKALTSLLNIVDNPRHDNDFLSGERILIEHTRAVLGAPQ